MSALLHNQYSMVPHPAYEGFSADSTVFGSRPCGVASSAAHASYKEKPLFDAFALLRPIATSTASQARVNRTNSTKDSQSVSNPALLALDLGSSSLFLRGRAGSVSTQASSLSSSSSRSPRSSYSGSEFGFESDGDTSLATIDSVGPRTPQKAFGMSRIANFGDGGTKANLSSKADDVVVHGAGDHGEEDGMESMTPTFDVVKVMDKVQHVKGSRIDIGKENRDPRMGIWSA